MRRIVSSLSLLALVALPLGAQAQDSGPHHARAGALLALADEETKIVFAVITAKVFDVELATTLVSELKDVMGDAKASAFRASQLVEDQKAGPELAKLDEAIKTIEATLATFDADLKRETKDMKPDEENPELAPAAGSGKAEAGTQPNWEALKDDCGALYRDISAARAIHGKLAKTVKAPALKAPPPPKKK